MQTILIYVVAALAEIADCFAFLGRVEVRQANLVAFTRHGITRPFRLSIDSH